MKTPQYKAKKSHFVNIASGRQSGEVQRKLAKVKLCGWAMVRDQGQSVSYAV